MKNYISDSLICEALIMMQEMEQNNCYELTQVEKIRTYYGINKGAALNLAIQFEWITIKSNDRYEITPLGDRIIRSLNGLQITQVLYRDILRNYIVVCKPIWARKIPYGRNEAYRIMSDEEQFCFKKAGLMSSPVSFDEVEWWDSLADQERQTIERQQGDVGRRGEELTMRYERERTNAEPTWESINSNLAGYDILSQKSSTDTSQLLIEVKTSTRTMQDAFFFISQNEWNFASAGYNQNRYYFYLWHLSCGTQLAIVSYKDMARHIPTDNGSGSWNGVSIPFSAFENVFSHVHFHSGRL